MHPLSKSTWNGKNLVIRNFPWEVLQASLSMLKCLGFTNNGAKLFNMHPLQINWSISVCKVLWIKSKYILQKHIDLVNEKYDMYQIAMI